MDLNKFVELAIAEDIRDGDHTSLACIPAGQTSKARLLVKDNGILAGVDVAQALFRGIDPELQVEVLLNSSLTNSMNLTGARTTGESVL